MKKCDVCECVVGGEELKEARIISPYRNPFVCRQCALKQFEAIGVTDPRVVAKYQHEKVLINGLSYVNPSQRKLPLPPKAC